MAYIGEDKVLLFGGDGTAETWIYDLSDGTWTQQSPASSPPALGVHAMAYIGGDRVMLFGGYWSGPMDETWIYDLSDSTWAKQSPPSSPPARYEHVMAYIGGDQVLLFGGFSADAYDDTWIYDLSDDNWIQLSPASHPSARLGHAMAYIGGDRVMLFGGYWSGPMDETWIYDLSDVNWTRDMNTMQPAPRDHHGLAETSFDDLSYPVLFGGSTGGSNNDETWIFGEGDYLVLAPPSINSVGDVPYDQGRQVAIIWERSFLDSPEYNLITHYSIWRLYPYGNTITKSQYQWDGTSLYDPDKIVCRLMPGKSGGDERESWELVGTVPAHFLDEYAFVAATYEDSSSGGIPYFSFFVSAQTTDPFVFYDSDPDSGYSVDNINPVPPQIHVQIAAEPSTLSLQWNQVTQGTDGSSELGTISYRIHSDTYPYFMPGPVNLLTTTSSLCYDHTDPGIGDPLTDLYYVIIATDGSDNQSNPSNRAGEIDFYLP